MKEFVDLLINSGIKSDLRREGDYDVLYGFDDIKQPIIKGNYNLVHENKPSKISGILLEEWRSNR
jgi:hypothetical protein